MFQSLPTLGWLACVIYSTIPSFWLMIHSRAEFWRRRRSSYRVLLPLWIAMWIIAGAATAPWRHLVLYSSPWSWIPALALFLAGFWTYSRAFRQFSLHQLGGLPEILPGGEQRLATSGIRARVRHPVYLAHLCEMLAWSVGTGLVVCYGLSAFALLTGAVMIRMEDAELAKRFGAAYEAYRERVPAVWPHLGQ